MSRIHEALQKARLNERSNEPKFPNVEDVISAGVQLHESAPPKLSADPDAALLTMLDVAGNAQSPVEQYRRGSWPSTGENLIFLAGDSHAAGQEQFRTLRSRLYQMRGNGQLQVIVVSSAIPGEGKSFVSANLAHTFSLQSDRRALVIDADLRRAGGLTTLFEAHLSPGLTDYLLGEQSADDVIQRGSLDNLFLISCGKRNSKPGELIGNSRFRTLIEHLRPSFDWIIIDTPPVLPIADARAIADLSDGVLMVVNARATLAHLAKRAAGEFRPESLLGVVLNRTADVSATYYAAYGYGSDQQKTTSK